MYDKISLASQGQCGSLECSLRAAAFRYVVGEAELDQADSLSYRSGAPFNVPPQPASTYPPGFQSRGQHLPSQDAWIPFKFSGGNVTADIRKNRDFVHFTLRHPPHLHHCQP